MKVSELMNLLKLANNKEAEVVFKTGDYILQPLLLAEVVLEKGTVHHAVLGEKANALVVKLSDIPSE